MRASDADRDRYAEILQDAYAEGRLTRDEYDDRLDACMKAKTFGDLEPLVSDLPRDNLPVVRPGADVVPVSRSNAPMVAVFSGVERKGAWFLAQHNVAFALFGQVSLDLRDVTTEAATSEIKAFALFGGVDIVVEPGTVVDCSGVGVFGEFSSSSPVVAPHPDSRVIRVTGLALFGAVTVKEKARKPR